MIGRLKGVVDEIAEDHLVLDVHGVGYEVFCPPRLLARCPPVGEATTLTIETVVREDMIRLYGFLSEAERDWFRLLQSVQGVGARLAVALLGVLSSEEIGRAIAERDARTIARAPGIGKRVAERIVVELADKVAKMPVAGEGRGASPAASVAPASAEDQAAADARSALVNLGYADEAARAAVARVRAERPEAGLATATLIRESLKVLSQ